MRYTEFKNGIKLSKLGLGAMRLPQTEPGFGKPVDEVKARELIDYCMAHGVNYYDTAYIYHGGRSETVIMWPISLTFRQIRTTVFSFRTSSPAFKWTILISTFFMASLT